MSPSTMRGLLVFLVLVLSASGISGQLSSTKAGSTYTRWTQFLSTLTSVLPTGERAVHSSGGAAGGVISEGQGYGLFFGAATAASLTSTDTNFNQVVTDTYALFKGWKTMCTKSTASTTTNCQATYYCGGGSYPCLPHWKFDDSIGSAQGTGSAPDGDEDAILGMIILLLVTEPNKASYSWWSEVLDWTYSSCKQFIDYEAAPQGNYLLLKLGACWGGWDCSNPSYHAPGAYRAMRNFMTRYQTVLNKGTEGTDYVAKWNTLISTSYALLGAAQCSTTGLVPNWYVPNSNPSVTGTTSCSGSGTPSAEFGAEASRTIWRVALDYLIYPDEATLAGTFLTKTATQVASKYTSSSWNNLDTGCLVTNIFSSWTTNSFIYGPTFTSLVYPVASIANQQVIIDAAATHVSGGSISDYYSGSWTAIAVLTLNGDLKKCASILNTNTAVTPNPPTPPTPPTTPPTAPPTAPSPPPTSPPSSATCSYAYNDNYWVEVNTVQNAVVSVECSDGRILTCVANYGKYQCDPKSVACYAPRNAIIDGACCDLGKTCPQSNPNPTPVNGGGPSGTPTPVTPPMSPPVEGPTPPTNPPTSTNAPVSPPVDSPTNPPTNSSGLLNSPQTDPIALSDGAIVGIIIGIVVLLVAIVLLTVKKGAVGFGASQEVQ